MDRIEESFGMKKLLTPRVLVLLAIGVVLVFIVALALNESGGQLLPASIVAYASCFALTVYFLRGRMLSVFELLLTSAATTFSGVWLYELAYHYFWGTSFASLYYDFSHFSIALGYSGGPFPIWFAIPVVLFPFLKKQYISMNKPLLFVLGASVGLFAIWFDLGLPQFFYPQYYEGTLLNPAQVSEIGYVMNSLTKLLAVIPAFLFCNKGLLRLDSEDRITIIQSLKNAFILLLAGGILAALPLTGILGLVIMAFGIFLIISSAKALGRSCSYLSPPIRSIGRRFVVGSITAFVILISGLIIITEPLGSYVESMVSIQNNTAILNNAAQTVPNFRSISYEIFGLVTIVYLVWMFAWMSLCSSVRIFAEELDQPRLVKTAVFYTLYVVVGFFGLISIFFYVLSGSSGFFFGTSVTTLHLYNILFYGAFYGSLVGGPWLIITFVLVGQAALIAVGSQLGYRSLRNFVGQEVANLVSDL